MRRIIAALTLVAGGLGTTGPGARAESIEEALSAAYATNPQLQARRAQGRAVDEAVPQALSNWRPTVSVALQGGRGHYESNNAFPTDQTRTPRSGTLTVSQPLYRGGRTVAGVAQAESEVRAERALLTSVEQAVLQSAAQAYVDVVRDRALVDLNVNNEQVLQRQLQATRDRFEVGEITQTDVAQAEARLARATADRLAAEGTLQASRATYERVVGAPPGTLAFPARSPHLPKSLDEATGTAIRANPEVLAAERLTEAAVYEVDGVKGELLPTVSLDGTLGRSWRTSSINSRTETAEAMLTVNVPLYQQGATYSRLREAKHIAGQRRLETDQARREVIEAATQAWETLQSAQAQIVSFQAQIAAAEVALDGVQREAQVGSRTVLDVLDAEQELLDARTNLVRAQRDELIAEYGLLAAIGSLTAPGLKLPVEVYDPEVHYQDVRNQWFGGSDAADADVKKAEARAGQDQ